jgi:ABC-type transport system involved in cytochrome c biogenesis, permease component
MTWNEFILFAGPAMILWICAGTLVYTRLKQLWIDLLMIAGIAVFASFIVGLWIGQERPPLRTMGETRLWYSFFLSLIGYITYKHWKYKWLLSFSGLVACVFVCINIFKPEIHSKNLMPALQSYWFVPHVTVYILSYAMLGAATIASFIQIRKLNRYSPDKNLYLFMDNLIYAGFGFLMLGLLMGCIWAKEAWGHYWSWDPKETWAFVTCGAYLIYIHLRLQNKHPKVTLWVLPIAFILLMITWIGVNYLPSAQNSIHTYS